MTATPAPGRYTVVTARSRKTGQPVRSFTCTVVTIVPAATVPDVVMTGVTDPDDWFHITYHHDGSHFDTPVQWIRHRRDLIPG